MARPEKQEAEMAPRATRERAENCTCCPIHGSGSSPRTDGERAAGLRIGALVATGEEPNHRHFIVTELRATGIRCREVLRTETDMLPSEARLIDANGFHPPAPAAAKAPEPLSPDERDRIAHCVMFAFHIYPNYRVDSRGPAGLLIDTLRIVRPDIADVFADDGDASRVYARFWDEEGCIREPTPPSPSVPSKGCPKCGGTGRVWDNGDMTDCVCRGGTGEGNRHTLECDARSNRDCECPVPLAPVKPNAGAEGPSDAPFAVELVRLYEKTLDLPGPFGGRRNAALALYTRGRSDSDARHEARELAFVRFVEWARVAYGRGSNGYPNALIRIKELEAELAKGAK